MTAYKQFLSSDVIVSPLTLNKGFTFYGAAQMTASNARIDRFIGKNSDDLFISPQGEDTTGQIDTLYQKLVFSSIKNLYYSNYQTSSKGDPINRRILLPGEDSDGDVYIGLNHTPNFENYLQSSIFFERPFPTASNSNIGVISIPSSLYGEMIHPGSFKITSGSTTLTDDGEGNIISSTNRILGNIFYSHGLIVLTNDFVGFSSSIYDSESYYDMEDYYDTEAGISLLGYITDSNVNCSFSSSITLYEHQFNCTINDGEFNLSLNPSLTYESNSERFLYDFATGSYFTPYITTVGLYNDANELLAVAKLANPLPTSKHTDMHVVVNLDMY